MACDFMGDIHLGLPVSWVLQITEYQPGSMADRQLTWVIGMGLIHAVTKIHRGIQWPDEK